MLQGPELGLGANHCTEGEWKRKADHLHKPHPQVKTLIAQVMFTGTSGPGLSSHIVLNHNVVCFICGLNIA